MGTSSDFERIVSLLAGERWSKHVKNTTARLIADTHADDEVVSAEHVVNDHYARYAKNRALMLAALADAGGCVSSVTTDHYEYRGKRLAYRVRLTGHRSDIARVEALYQGLVSYILGRVFQIEGDNCLALRREAFLGFITQVAQRLRDVAAVPVCSWVPEHREEARKAVEAA